jgi:RNA polymerase sigma-70 factor, ECF subfamily
MEHRGISALEELYDLTASRLLRYAHSLTRNREDAEDAVQTAMIRLALKPKLLKNAKYPWSYFLRIVRNEAINISRKKMPMQLLTSIKEFGKEEPARLDAEHIKFHVSSALDKLPPAQSEVVILKVWENMTFAEIAEVLGQSPNTIASRYRYAIEKLSQYLQPFCEEVQYES